MTPAALRLIRIRLATQPIVKGTRRDLIISIANERKRDLEALLDEVERLGMERLRLLAELNEAKGSFEGGNKHE